MRYRIKLRIVGFDWFVTIKAHVFNERPSIPTSVKFHLEAETSKGNFSGNQIPLADLRLKRSQKDTDHVPQMSKTVSVIVEMKELAQVGERLTLGPGEVGWLRFVIPEENAPREEIEAIALVAIDDYGTRYPIHCPKSEWNQSGELVRQRDLDYEDLLKHMTDHAYRDA